MKQKVVKVGAADLDYLIIATKNYLAGSSFPSDKTKFEEAIRRCELVLKLQLRTNNK